MRTIPIAQVDAFTTQLFGGNPAGVVLDANSLTDQEMQNIAREMNLSETAFVLKSKTADFKLRYFTPEKEIRFCGHATVGSLYALAKHHYFNMRAKHNYLFRVETKVGILNMNVRYDTEKDIAITFNAPKINLQKTTITHADIAYGLGINKKYIDETKPIMIEKTNDYIFVSIKSLKDLGNITYDYESAKKFSEKKSLMLFCLVCQETFDKKNNIHSRVFAPAMGLQEDPVTGSTQGGLVAYLLHNKMIPASTKTIRSEQGHFVNRPGELTVTFDKKEEGLEAQIHASAVMVFSTEIQL